MSHDHTPPTPHSFSMKECAWTIVAMLLCALFVGTAYQIHTVAGHTAVLVVGSYFVWYCYFSNDLGENDVAVVTYGKQVVRMVAEDIGYPFILRPVFTLKTFPYREVQFVLGRGAGKLHGPILWGCDLSEPGIRFSPQAGTTPEERRKGFFLFPQVTLVLLIKDYGLLLKNEGDFHAAATQVCAIVYRFLEDLSTDMDPLEFDNGLSEHAKALYRKLEPIMRDHMGLHISTVQMTAGLPAGLIGEMEKRGVAEVKIDTAEYEKQAGLKEAEVLMARKQVEAADEILKLQKTSEAVAALIQKLKAQMPNASDKDLLEAVKSIVDSTNWNTATVSRVELGGVFGGGQQRRGH